MSKLVRIHCGASVATLLVILAAGCAWAPTWPGQTSLASDPPPAARPRSQRVPFDPDTACAGVVKAHNRIRADAKLPSLTVSPKLEESARRHAKDMAAHHKMTHTGTDGSSSLDRIAAQGYQYRRAGENIAAGRFTIDELMNGWMDSPPHKRNILGSFSQIGVAYATAENGKRYWCVNFGFPTRH
jgi:uncharacterized protein YkwD